MASKDRIQRLKDETRTKILDASLQIVKQEGWPALSMRKIADAIEYTAPIIYEYFSNKDAILLELTRHGFLHLTKKLTAAKAQHEQPEKQLEAMWMAYWNFAFAEKELYQVMFGVDVNCCELCEILPEAEMPYTIISEVIEQLMVDSKPTEDEVCAKYYTFWSVVHGLVSINMVRKNTSEDINKEVLQTAITEIIRSLKE
jgi:AcrR family transcriptional regulator